MCEPGTAGLPLRQLAKANTAASISTGTLTSMSHPRFFCRRTASTLSLPCSRLRKCASSTRPANAVFTVASASRHSSIASQTSDRPTNPLAALAGRERHQPEQKPPGLRAARPHGAELSGRVLGADAHAQSDGPQIASWDDFSRASFPLSYAISLSQDVSPVLPSLAKPRSWQGKHNRRS
jgi:hypothetical protein